MGKKKYDTEIFIQESKKIHGDKYDYSLSNYVKYDQKLKIICKKHGIFEQSPVCHMHNNGCVKCFHEKESSNTIDFIEKSEKIHKNEFDYSMVEYKNSYTKVKIICKKHGVFEQKPQSHLIGQKCKKCVNEKQTSNIIEFIEKATLVHNGKYDYSLSEYINNESKMKIICPIHGIFKQIASNHLNGNGCLSCRIENSKNKNYIELCKDKFKGKFDYSLVEYKNNKIKVKIICPEHGIFEQSLKDHYNAEDCPYCSGKKMNTNLFIKKSKKIHNDKYDYSLVDYISAFRKITIICPEHGIFEQKPSSHLFGSGCQICKFSKGENKIMTFLKENNIENESQKTFNECVYKSNLYFDFFIPSKNTCIEFNGIQHYFPFKFFGGEEEFKITKLRDKIKKDFCKKNNIKLMIIKYNDNIDKKLNKLL